MDDGTSVTHILFAARFAHIAVLFSPFSFKFWLGYGLNFFMQFGYVVFCMLNYMSLDLRKQD